MQTRLIQVATALMIVVLVLHADGESQDKVTVRVAAISFVPKKFDLGGNVDRLEQAFRAAQKGGAKIAVGPEGALEGFGRLLRRAMLGSPKTRVGEH